MSRKIGKVSWMMLVVCSSITTVWCVNIAYPDSYEMYSYKQPRTMNDLKHQHMRQAMIDVTETINEVQKILQKDPKLPRLTRGEIEDLFEMVTREEYKRSLAAGDYQRAKHMRSLMLVLPFNTNNYSEERLEELFTRMPVTKMVDNVPRVQKPQRFVVPATQESAMVDMMGAPTLAQQMPTTFKPNYAPNMKTMYTAGVTTFHPKNVQMVTTLYPTNLPPQTPGGQPMMITNYYPRSTMQAMPPYLPKAGATPFTTVYNPKPTYDPMSTLYPPKTPAQTIYYPKGTLQSFATNAIPTEYISQFHPRLETKAISHKSATDSIDAGTSQIPYMTMALRDNYNKRFTLPNIDEMVQTVTPTLRPNVKSLLAKIGLEPDSNALEINNEMSELQQSSSTKVEVAAKATAATTTTTTPTTTTTTTKKPELTPELRELLLSFGLLSNEERSAQVDDPIRDEAALSSPSSLKDESLSLNEFKPLPKSVTSSHIEEKIDSSFEIKPDDFSSFKPLPIQESVPTKDEELESLLKSYGILDKTSDDAEEFDSQNSESEATDVTEKIPPMSRVPDVDVGFLTPDLTKVLGNIGINNINKDQINSVTPQSTRRFDKKQATTAAQASTSPVGTVSSTTMENDYQKLHLLLDTIKELDSLTANLTDEELEKLNLRNFNFSQDVLNESVGPGPTYDHDSNALKNEVKREINSSEPTRIQLDITGTTTASIDPTSTDELRLDVKDDDDEDDGDDDKTVGAVATTTAATATTSTTTETSERKGKQDNLDSDDAGSDKVTEKDTDSADLVSSSTTTTTEESKSANIGELAASFGGNSDGLDPVSEEPLPPPRKNGFYFFADWNSFLEVGLDDDKVEVKFEPKVGDNSQFVPVKIP